jgi:hypothetical protein
MIKIWTKILCMIAGGVLISVATGVPVSATSLSSGSALNMRLLNSSSPKVVVLDPRTGAVLSVKPLKVSKSTGIQPMISNHNFCNASDACYRTNTPPYANQGFYGTAGTYYGSWPYRYGGFSGAYYARFCWTAACSPLLAPNTSFTYGGGTLQTGTSVTI